MLRLLILGIYPVILSSMGQPAGGSASEGAIMIRRKPTRPHPWPKATGHLSPARVRMLVSTVLFI
jgi:hypothetical protein